MIEFKEVSFQYSSERKVIDHVSFHIEKGESVGLIGANGAGKSTVMKLLLGLLEGEGEIRISDIPVNRKNLSAIRKICGFVLQNADDQMFMPTVYEDMIFGPRNYGLSKEETEKKIDEILRLLDIQDLKHRYNHKLSGGEKRMTAIATVLAMEPQILLMDEPTAALDPYNRRMVINIINKLPQTKIITSHDLDMILDTCDRVILLGNGKIVADGKCQDILSNQKLLEENRLELPLSFMYQKEKELL
ncbi:MAG: ABC transporter ATP-binding protein [Solobacterium sp.]|nr:ABC transporter ATP-binding protein [Solobacterium sp.]